MALRHFAGMNNYKVTVREVREWTFLIGAGSALEAAALGKLKAVCSEKPHETWFEDPVAYYHSEVPTIMNESLDP